MRLNSEKICLDVKISKVPFWQLLLFVFRPSEHRTREQSLGGQTFLRMKKGRAGGRWGPENKCRGANVGRVDFAGAAGGGRAKREGAEAPLSVLSSGLRELFDDGFAFAMPTKAIAASGVAFD